MCFLLAGCGSGGASAPPLRTGPESLFQAPAQLAGDPAGTLSRLKALGVARVRVFVGWSAVAPGATSSVRPSGFTATDPSSYPAASWVTYDKIVRDAAARGVGVDLTLSGPAPLWATGAGEPRKGPAGVWKPNATEFGAFVRAVATRYSGTFKPPGFSRPLPRVNFWAIWNEPNYGVDLAPQAIDNSTVEVSPALYRGLLDAAWNALQQTGHGNDTILIGEVAPRGITFGDSPGNFSGMVPLRFVRALYCVDDAYHPLRGSAAAIRGCPTDASGSATFAGQHPALFRASGFADHPYPQGQPPNMPTADEPDYADLPAVPRLERVLDAVQRLYGSNTRFPIYDTEFGYQTNPPEKLLRAIRPATAAWYLNWAEYMHYQDPRIRSYDQYLLADPVSGSFATGLEYVNGAPKATLDAYRMPLYLPVTTTAAGGSLEVWGCVRPARYVSLQTGRAQRVELQLQAASGGPFKTIRTVPVTNPNGYFNVREVFNHSGRLRTSWTDPHGATFHSRIVIVTIR